LAEQRDTLACRAARALSEGHVAEAKREAQRYADIVREIHALPYTPEEIDPPAQTSETLTTVEALEALPLGTVILAEVPEPKRGMAERALRTMVLERSTMGYGNPEKPGFRAFNGARYGREWFSDLVPARVLYAPEGVSHE